MVTMNQALADLYLKQRISYQEALTHSSDPEDLKKYLQRGIGQTTM